MAVSDKCEWEMVGGLEIHAQIASRAKLFSGASTAFGGEPNTQVSLIDAAFPGMLPVLNEECVRQAVRVGLALGAEVNLHSVFARKNYFYPDLPQGYQISQYDKPIIGAGSISLDVAGVAKRVEIERLHLEQDAGKSLHDKGFSCSYIDLNRSGVALMEIVTRPDLRSADEAVACVEKIRSILLYLGACDGNMAEGSLRADMNVSLRRFGSSELGVRAEIKNINSLKFLRQAIEFEMRRQVAILDSGGVVVQETRLFDSEKGETRSMRSKEDAHDYRYFPDPDLLPLVLSADYVEALQKSLPELPDAKRERFIVDYGLSESVALILVGDRFVADYFERVAVLSDSRSAANWIVSELFGGLHRAGLQIGDSPISAESLAELICLIDSGDISGKMAKDIFEEMFRNGESALFIIERDGLRQISDDTALSALVDSLLAANSRQVEQYRSGKQNVFGWFVGQAMKETQGKANPQTINRLLKAKLG